MIVFTALLQTQNSNQRRHWFFLHWLVLPKFQREIRFEMSINSGFFKHYYHCEGNINQSNVMCLSDKPIASPIRQRILAVVIASSSTLILVQPNF